VENSPSEIDQESFQNVCKEFIRIVSSGQEWIERVVQKVEFREDDTTYNFFSFQGEVLPTFRELGMMPLTLFPKGALGDLHIVSSEGHSQMLVSSNEIYHVIFSGFGLNRSPKDFADKLSIYSQKLSILEILEQMPTEDFEDINDNGVRSNTYEIQRLTKYLVENNVDLEKAREDFFNSLSDEEFRFLGLLGENYIFAVHLNKHMENKILIKASFIQGKNYNPSVNVELDFAYSLRLPNRKTILIPMVHYATTRFHFEVFAPRECLITRLELFPRNRTKIRGMDKYEEDNLPSSFAHLIYNPAIFRRNRNVARVEIGNSKAGLPTRTFYLSSILFLTLDAGLLLNNLGKMKLLSNSNAMNIFLVPFGMLAYIYSRKSDHWIVRGLQKKYSALLFCNAISLLSSFAALSGLLTFGHNLYIFTLNFQGVVLWLSYLCYLGASNPKKGSRNEA
jgi:hypothetical protein